MRSKGLIGLMALCGAGALLGFSFAAVSSYDFIQHLDRQVHGVHCSFVPGLGDADISGTTGCHATLMSPYSSVLRHSFWGGIPISLPAMAVFAFIGFLLADLALSRRTDSKRATGLLAAATAIPALTSLVMGTISVTVLDAVCTVCAGIYFSSALVFAGGLGLFLRARKVAASGYGPGTPEPGLRYFVQAAVAGVAFLALPFLAYMALVPDHSRFVGTCGALTETKDTYGVFVPMGDEPGRVPAIEVLDPLCPACRAFEERLHDTGFDERMSRQAVLFPLDSTCNWMVSDSLHPGACTVSEAILCAPDRAPAIIRWAFAEQERIRDAAKADPKAPAELVSRAFPEVKSCVGSAAVRSKLNKSLRWVVRNELPVLTPQLYINGTKLCDEDTDLGMEFALGRMLDAAKAGGTR